MAHNDYPLHDFSKDDASSIAFKILHLHTKSDYDFTLPHRHNYYEIFLFDQGGGTHLIDFEEFPINSWSLHFLSPGQVHQMKRAPESFGVFIAFSREFYYLNRENKDLLFELPFLNNNTSRPLLDLAEPEYASLRTLVQSMENETSVTGQFKEEMLRSWLNILLIQCRRLFNEREAGTRKSAGNEIFTRFRILMEKHFIRLHKPSDYADELSISEKHLNEIVKASTGKTVSDVLQERLILEARRLLIHSGLSTKEIAYFLNFEDPSYFTKVFKRNTGLTPGQFQEETRRKMEE